MLAKSIAALAVVAFLLAVSRYDVSAFMGVLPGTLLMAVVIGGCIYAMSNGREPGGAMSNQGEDESVDVRGPMGFGVTARGPRLLTDGAKKVGSLWGRSTITNALIISVGVGLWLHHAFTEDLAKKTLAAMEEGNYLSTQTEAQRLEIGKRIAMPKSLADKMRPRDHP